MDLENYVSFSPRHLVMNGFRAFVTLEQANVVFLPGLLFHSDSSLFWNYLLLYLQQQNYLKNTEEVVQVSALNPTNFRQNWAN